VAIPNGSDFPVEAVNPLISFHSFFHAQDADNFPPGGWMPSSARRAGSAAVDHWCGGVCGIHENESGSLSTGKYADFVVLDRDIMTVAPEKVLATHCC